MLRSGTFDLVLFDARLAGRDPAAVLDQFQTLDAATPLVVFHAKNPRRFLELGFDGVLGHPGDTAALEAVLQAHLGKDPA